jgi:hypothetical protein
MASPTDPQFEDFDDGRRDPSPEAQKPVIRHPLRIGFKVGAVVAGIGLFAAGIKVLQDVSLRSAMQNASANNLKQIGLAIQNYYDTTGELPSNVYSIDGKPLLSWRVLLLPYLEHDNIYRQIKLDEPWDSPANIRLLNQMPSCYSGHRHYGESMTNYRGFSSRGAVFERRLVLEKPREERDQLKLTDLPNGPADTILVVEAGLAVEWTKPDDLDASPGKPFPRMGGLGWNRVFQALMADGSIRQFPLDTPGEVLRGFVVPGGRTIPSN